MKEDPTKVIIRGLRRTFYPPIHHAPMDNSPPDKKLQLHWVHGYRGIDSRRNLWVLPSGELLYYVAAVAVLLDRDEEAQRHYTGHTEDIMWWVVLIYNILCGHRYKIIILPRSLFKFLKTNPNYDIIKLNQNSITWTTAWTYIHRVN